MPVSAAPVEEAPERGLTPRGRATRERLVSAAAQLVHQRGVARTSLDDVLAATGTSKSQLYHYFADKSALVRAVVQHQVERVLAAQQPELDEIDSVAALWRWVDHLLALNAPQGCAGGCALGRLASELAEGDPRARAVLAAGFAAWQDRLAAGLRRLQAGGELDAGADPDALAAGLLAAVQGGLLLGQAARSTAPLAAALDLAVAGLPTRPPHRPSTAPDTAPDTVPDTAVPADPGGPS